MEKRLAFLFLAASFIGLLDAAYLTVEHYSRGSVVCSVLGFNGCDLVLAGPYAAIGGVPVALLGVGYYLVIFVSALSYLIGNKNWALPFASRLTAVGFAASLWFVYLQVFVIKAICPYCMVSAFLSLILFIGGLVFVLKSKQIDQESHG